MNSNDIQNARDLLTGEKRLIEVKLLEIKNRIRASKGRMATQQYRALCEEQTLHMKRMAVIEDKILKLNISLRQLTETCPNCGGSMVGDGYTMPRHCESIEAPEGAEPDSGPWHCQAHLERLLAGVQALVQPHYASLNEHAGRNDRLLHAVLCAYAKHQLDCAEIGWSQLGTILHNAICNEIGDSAYVAWAESISPERKSGS